jgi:hypothetical protein
MEGKLYGQEYSRTRGYRGGVFQVSLDGTEQRDSLLTKPERMDLYDFNLFPTPDDPDSVIAYDERGHVLLYGGGGEPVWMSSEVYAKPTRKYESEKMTAMAPSRKWTLKPRIIIRGDTALAIVRKPVAKIAGTGVWHKDSKLIKLYLKGGSVGESVILGEIPGKILDYNVSDDKVFVLLGSKLSIAPENIIKGKSLFATKLYIYSIRGS